MLYAKVVRAYTYTKATYDVHAVFSVHVCHSFIHCITCSLLYDCLFLLFIFKFFFLGVYKFYTQLCVLHLLGISLEYHILAHVARTFQQVYTRYILHITGFPTYLSLY